MATRSRDTAANMPSVERGEVKGDELMEPARGRWGDRRKQLRKAKIERARWM